MPVGESTGGVGVSVGVVVEQGLELGDDGLRVVGFGDQGGAGLGGGAGVEGVLEEVGDVQGRAGGEEEGDGGGVGAVGDGEVAGSADLGEVEAGGLEAEGVAGELGASRW